MSRIYIFTTMISLSLIVSSCTEGGNDFSSLDNSSGQNAEGIGRCSIKELLPGNVSPVKVSGQDGAISNFIVTSDGTNCEARFFLNGSTTPFHRGSMTASILSSNLVAGVNSVRVELIGPIGSDFAEWSVIKNEVPTCSLVTPALPNINAVEGSNISLMVSAGIQAGEIPSFNWRFNGATSSRLSRTLETGTISQYAFNTSTLTGLSSVDIQVSDGTDTAFCSYTINVGADCSLTGKNPDVPALRMAASPNSQLFEATSAANNCIVTWTINGVPVPGTGLTRTANSTEFNTGSNILAATVIASSGTSSQQWIVNKNSPPSCNQSPIGNLSLSSGSILNLQSLFNDSNNDLLSWTWGINGSTSAATPPLLTITNGVNTTNANFAPTNLNLGFNSIGIAVSDGLDTSNCTWSVTVNPACGISSRSPNSSALTIANLGTTQNIFGVTPTAESCNISWTLNGINLGSNLALQTIMSSTFLNNNVLRATVSNATSAEFHEWNIIKNTTPTCDSQTPGPSGLTIGVGNNQNLSLTVGDPDLSQNYSYTWRMNGSELTSGFLSINPPSGKTTSALWVPISDQVGSNIVSVQVSDGFDSRTCSWNTTVLPDCVITQSNPPTASIKVRNEATTTSQFVAIPNSTCSVTWSLNGSPIGSLGSILDITSAALNNTPNTLIATAANAVSSVQRSWSITKNQLTTCSTQTPNPGFLTVIDVNNSQLFSSNVVNPDGDALNFSWRLGGNPSPAFGVPTNTLASSEALFTPGFGQVGNGQLLSLRVDDGFDMVNCNWSVDVRDPNIAQIISVTPNSNPVILLSNGSIDLSVAASGTGIQYQWFINNILDPLRVTSTQNFSSLQLNVPGVYQVRVRVVDSSHNSAEHTFNVKRNARPAISSFSPNEVGVHQYSVGLNSSLNFAVSATDQNGDVLSYTWTLNNAASSNISPSGNTASFNPSGQTLLIGPHILRVTASDGSESVTQSWNVGVNYFSDECNTLFSSSTTGPNGGRVCTLVGNPSIGDDENVMLDPTLIKGRFRNTIELEPQVYAFTDWDAHIVGVINESGTPKNYFNKPIAPGKMRVVLGYGARGINSDLNSDEDAFNSVTGIPRVKLHAPESLLYDSTSQLLYISDTQNHRVISLNQAGKVIRILGLGGGRDANDSVNSLNAPLSSSSVGTNVVCREPASMALNNEGPNRFLYVTCGWSNVLNPDRGRILKLNITNFNGINASDVTASVAAGKLMPSGNFYPSARVIDGLAFTPGDSTILTGATAQARRPNGLFSHDGLIYFMDIGKIRVFNPKNSNVTFFGNLDAIRTQMSTGSSNVFFRGLFLNNESIPATELPTNSMRISTLSSTAPNNSIFTGASNSATGTCLPISVQLANGASRVVASTNTTLTVEITAGAPNSGIFNSLASCDTGNVVSSTTITATSGRSLGTVWIRASTAGVRTVRVTNPSWAATHNVTFAAPGVNTPNPRTIIQIPTEVDAADCSPVNVALFNGAGTSQISNIGEKSIVVTHNNIGTFYSDSACSAPLVGNRIIFANGTIAQTTIFYDRKVIVLPNHVASIAGFERGHANNNAAIVNEGNYLDYTTSRDGVSTRFIGSLYVNARAGQNARKLTSFGNFRVGGQDFPQGIIYGTEGVNGGHAVFMLNLSSTTLFAGTSRNILPLSARVIAGPNADNTNPGYNGDDQPAVGATFNEIVGLTVLANQSSLIVNDYNNRRARLIELGPMTPFVRPFIGIGRQRMRTNNMAISAQNTTLARPFKLEYLNNELFFSELSNSRIRKVNLTTGITSVVAGIGAGDIFNDGNDATTEFLREPRGFKVVAWPNSLAPTNYVLVYAERCHVRAVNLSGPNITNFMGRGILPGKVTTIAGNTSALTCVNTGVYDTDRANLWTGGSPINSNGMDARFARFGLVEDIAFINNEIHIIDRNMHCLLRITSTGQLFEVGTGTCGRPAPAVTEEGIFDGSIGARFQSRHPIAFYPDSTIPGSYFLVQNFFDATSMIAYINASVNPLNFFGLDVTANGRAASVARVTNILPIGTNLRPGGIASWSASPGTNSPSDILCYSTGEPENNDNSPLVAVVAGLHNIYCAQRTVSPQTSQIAAGPSTNRAGAPLGREQELAGRFNVSFDSPNGIAFDEDGNLYVADQNNHIIRMIRRWW